MITILQLTSPSKIILLNPYHLNFAQSLLKIPLLFIFSEILSMYLNQNIELKTYL